MKEEKIHVGALVKDFVKENNINASELARKLGKTQQNLYDLYKRDDIGVKELLSISKVLNHNFLADIQKDKQSITVDDVFDALKEVVNQKIKK